MFDNSFDGMLPVLIFFLCFYGFLLLGALANYILRGIGILRLSKSRGLEYGWLGFIPVAAEYQLGKISGEIEIGNKKMRNPGLWMVLLPVIIYGVFFTVYFIAIFSVAGIFSVSSFSGHGEPSSSVVISLMILIFVFYLLMIAGAIFILIVRLLVLHRIFSCHFNGQRPVFYVILCAFVPLAQAILLFNLANKPMINPPDYMRGNMNPYQHPYYYPPQTPPPYNPPQMQMPSQYNPPQPPQENQPPADFQPTAETKTNSPDSPNE